MDNFLIGSSPLDGRMEDLQTKKWKKREGRNFPLTCNPAYRYQRCLKIYLNLGKSKDRGPEHLRSAERLRKKRPEGEFIFFFSLPESFSFSFSSFFIFYFFIFHFLLCLPFPSRWIPEIRGGGGVRRCSGVVCVGNSSVGVYPYLRDLPTGRIPILMIITTIKPL